MARAAGRAYYRDTEGVDYRRDIAYVAVRDGASAEDCLRQRPRPPATALVGTSPTDPCRAVAMHGHQKRHVGSMVDPPLGHSETA